jgi:hypothetical protein
MKNQRLSLKVARGIAFIAVLMLSSSLWADTILFQYAPVSPNHPDVTIAYPTVTPGASTQVTVTDFIQNEGFTRIASTAAWNRNETSLVARAQQLGIDTEFSVGPANFDQYDYFLGFTAPGSNVILDGFTIEIVISGEADVAFFNVYARGGGPQFELGTCDKFDVLSENYVGGGECMALADGQIHDLGLLTDVDNLEVQLAAPDASVPEPSSFLLLGTGLVSGAAGLRRKLDIKN